MRTLSWFPDSIRSIAEETFGGGHVKDVPALFAQLKAQSDVLIRKKLGKDFFAKYFPSNRRGGKWTSKNPIGVVDHYTSAPSVEGTLRWFSNFPRGPESPESSAHLVVDRSGEIYVVIDPLEYVAWHARQANSTHIGIEHVNAGPVTKQNGVLCFMGCLPYPKDRYGLIGRDGHGEAWECYTVPQIISNIILKRWFMARFPSIQQCHLTDHATLDPLRKRDCGPLWPLAAINALACSQRDLSNLSWVSGGIATPDVVKAIQDGD